MRIHTKLLILLLMIALLPLAVLTLRGQRATEAFGLAIADQGSAVVTAEIETRLQQTVAYSSALISSQQRQVETAVRLQALEVERRLAGPAPEGEIAIYRDRDFKDPATWPPGTELALDHVRGGAGREMNAVPTSRIHQSFYDVGQEDSDQDLAPEIALEARRLAGMDDVYRRLSTAAPGLYYWQFITLGDGLHSVFPGHGGYPPGFDPRTRVWYRTTVRANDFTWTPPTIDASTRRLLLTAAMPVHGSDGRILGVTGIEMDILARLTEIQTGLNLGGNAASYIVRVADRDGAASSIGADLKSLSVRALASSSYADTGAAWDAQVDQPVLAAGDTDKVQDMIRDIAGAKAGMRRMPQNGIDAIWVYGPIEGLNAALLYVVPVQTIAAVADQARQSIWNVTTEQMHLAAIASLGLMLVVAMISLVAARSVTQPLRHLAEVAKGLAAGRLEMRAEIESADEIGELAEAFNAMVPELQNHIYVKEGLALANEVQQKLLPASAPKLPGYDIAGLSLYSEDVGGDYYDFLEMTGLDGRRRVGIVVGDVVGHGVAAAMTMTTVRVLLRSYAGNGEYLLPAMRAVNHHLAEDASGGRFVTLVYLVIDPVETNRQMRWISAGQGPLLFYDAVENAFDELEVQDIPLGVEDRWLFHETARTAWPAQGVLVIGTDGIWETTNERGESFGREGFQTAIRDTAHLSAHDICHAVAARLRAFRGTMPQRDDVTLVVVKFV